MDSLYKITLDNIISKLSDNDKDVLVKRIMSPKLEQTQYTNVIIGLKSLNQKSDKYLEGFSNFLLKFVSLISKEMNISASLDYFTYKK